MKPSRSTLFAALLALAAGALWGLAFGEAAMVLVPWVALVPLLLLLGRGRRASWDRPALWGFLFGLAFWLTSIPWIFRVLRLYGGLGAPLAAMSLVGLACYLALYPAAFAGLGARLWPRRRDSDRRGELALALLALPSLWVAFEWLRAWLFSGFPWNLAAYAWVEVPGALPLSAWIGAYGISWLLVFANTGVALGISRRRWEVAAVGILVPAVLLAAGGRWGRGEPVYTGPDPQPVRLLQPDIVSRTGTSGEQIWKDYRRVLGMVEDSCQPGALVVLPESALWPLVWEDDPRLRSDLEKRLQAGRCWLLFNSVAKVTSGPGEAGVGGWYNAAYLLGPHGGLARYDKRHLVPFGEYVPLSSVFSFLDKIARNAGAFVPGERVVLLDWRRERLGPAVCFEVIFPAEVAQLVEAGATLLVTITNDSWYGDSSAPWQHLRAARFRAAESRRAMLRAAITGVSALITSDGDLRAPTELFERDVVRARVSGRLDVSPYSRRPWLVPLICSLVAIFGIIAGWKR